MILNKQLTQLTISICGKLFLKVNQCVLQWSTLKITYFVYTWQASLNQWNSIPQVQWIQQTLNHKADKFSKFEHWIRSGLIYFLNIGCSYGRDPLKQNNLLKTYSCIILTYHAIHSDETNAETKSTAMWTRNDTWYLT